MKLSLDITGPFDTAPQNERFLVTITDYFSKYPEVLLTGTITSRRIIRWLDSVFARFGNPYSIASDNGTQFVSNEFKQFLRQRNILHIRSPVYHPMANGLVEVFNRFLKRGIECLSAQAGSFESGINDLLIQFRSTAPEFGKSPAELMFGWKI